MQIRLATPGDAQALLKIYLPFVHSSAITFEEGDIGVDQFVLRIAETLKKRPWIVAVDRSEILGYASAASFNPRASYRWSANVSVYVDGAHQRKGVATRLYLALLDCLRLQNYRNALAGITLPNDSSIALHEGLGFRRVALYEQIGFKLGEWRDVAWYQLKLQDVTGEPIDLPQAEARISARLLQAR